VTDRDELAQLASKLGLLVDAREWTSVQELFCDAIDVDYTSLSGGEPQRLAPAELVEGWKANLESLRATQHLIANHVVTLDGDEARIATNVTATHISPDDSDAHWVVGGRYDMVARRTSAGWRIAALTLTVSWMTGSQEIMGGG